MQILVATHSLRNLALNIEVYLICLDIFIEESRFWIYSSPLRKYHILICIYFLLQMQQTNRQRSYNRHKSRCIREKRRKATPTRGGGNSGGGYQRGRNSTSGRSKPAFTRVKHFLIKPDPARKMLWRRSSDISRVTSISFSGRVNSLRLSRSR